MTWWLFQRSRLASEKACLAELEESVDWLSVKKWHADSELSMRVNFAIAHGGIECSFEMEYPSVFPDSPPMIFTENRTRISGHQYGADGELCLEYRPDNWRPSITGADMVASCYRLLAEEHPDEGELFHARSAHVASIGRDLRSAVFRFVTTASDMEALNSLEEHVVHGLCLKERFAAVSVVASLAAIGDREAPVWTGELVLPDGAAETDGVVVRMKKGRLGSVDTISDIDSLLEREKLTEIRERLTQSDETTRLLLGEKDNWILFWLYGEANDRKLYKYRTIRIPATRKRVPESFEELGTKKVGLVGCGSVGSKVAASLCRSGVKEFLIIDEDIFFPANVVRNELDLTSVGAHKAYAVQARLQQICPKCVVRTLRLSLGGQESGASMAGALEALGECDMLIDATADPRAFNLVASVSTRTKTPMIWCQVFAGGIGGLIARARPDVDPIPVAARAQIHVWCEDQGVDWVGGNGESDYEAEGIDGEPMVADDAAVSVIASHATRFAIDVLVNPGTSIFPASAYLIGLSPEWIFHEPFDTAPIELSLTDAWGELMDPLSVDDMIAVLKKHLPLKSNADGRADTT